MTDWPPPELPRLSTPPPGPATRAWAERLRAVESRNVTHLGGRFPVFWTRASGVAVGDADGNTYLDLTGAFGVAVAGHGHPRITAAIREQAGRLAHGMGDVHPPVRKVELLERLAAVLPWQSDTRTVLASAGSEAVEVALKTALLATGRPGIVAFEGGYHGLTLGALATTERRDFRDPFRPRLYGGVRFVPFPTSEAETEACLAALAQALEAPRGDPEGDPAADPEGDPVADPVADPEGDPGGDPVGDPQGDPVGAVVVEPIQGRGGVRVPPAGFLARAAELTRQAGALFILDEIFTGMGRTGRILAAEHEGVEPDLICLGKALGGGLPLSACAGPRRVMDAWPPSPGEALHTSTFLGHPLACAASEAFLAVLQEEGLPERAEALGVPFIRGLTRALDGVEGVVQVRGRGLFTGVELDRPGGGVRVAEEALARGLLVLPAGPRGEVVELTPPLVISAGQLERATEILADAVRAARVASRPWEPG